MTLNTVEENKTQSYTFSHTTGGVQQTQTADLQTGG